MSEAVPSGLIESAAVDPQNPWPGLVAYNEQAQVYFHGRNDEALELYRRVRRGLLCVLFGESGLGKTSLLQAGLFPQLRRDGFLPVLVRFDFASQMPLSEQVLKLLGGALDATGSAGAARPVENATFWEYFHRRHDGIGRPDVPVLVLDQFEELFTHGRASAESRRRSESFLVQLSDLVENRVPAELEGRFEASASGGRL